MSLFLLEFLPSYSCCFIFQERLHQIDQQQRDMLQQAKIDIECLEKKRQKLLEDFRREKMRLAMTEKRIKELSRICHVHPENNNEILPGIPGTSDCDVQVSVINYYSR
jgi:hypothetical protein